MYHENVLLMIFEIGTDAPNCTGQWLKYEIILIQRGVAISSVSQFLAVEIFLRDTIG